MSAHTKLVIGQLPFYKLPTSILLATALIFMDENEQLETRWRSKPTQPNGLETPLKLALHNRVKAELTEYAIARLHLAADEMIEDIFNRIEALTQGKIFNDLAAELLAPSTANLSANGMLPPDWKRQLMAYLLPAFTMDKQTT
ncbi:hypothetical protein OPS25_11250 [Alteromonas ponticola]|uniref:Uncharacterized protein n=1 Tax=Alteromonas aquimaris TaxID=2998417 RepID=A0ABT3P8I0_9ALTE|nr:hypothetical protein [Alteromonas aquimaris]MCW8109072.1 hypothetical protein [Alteromonas aquimaris]